MANMNSVASRFSNQQHDSGFRNRAIIQPHGLPEWIKARPDATATGRSAADAAANAANTGGYHRESRLAEIADRLQGKIAAITSEATIAKVFIADLALSAIIGIIGQSLADFINDLVGRESDAEPITASTATANAESGSVALAFAEEGSAADAECWSGWPGASAEGTSNSTALAKSGLDAFAKADHQSTADANAASDSVEAFTINATSASQIATSTPSEPVTLQRGGSIILPFAINGAGIESLASVVIFRSTGRKPTNERNAECQRYRVDVHVFAVIRTHIDSTGNIRWKYQCEPHSHDDDRKSRRRRSCGSDFRDGRCLNRETVNVTKTAEVVSQETNLNIPGVPASVLNGVELNNADATDSGRTRRVWCQCGFDQHRSQTPR
ncbi:MAG: hypothetical protein R3C56_30230 [Pirellulaceae bacterium]